MFLFYFLVFGWILNSHCSLTLTKVAFCFHSLRSPWFQVLNKLESPKRFRLCYCSSFCSRAFCCGDGVSLSLVLSPSYLSLSWYRSKNKACKEWVSCRGKGSEQLQKCPSPIGSLVSSFVYLSFWIPLGLPHIAWTSWMLCIFGFFFHLMLIEVEQPLLTALLWFTYQYQEEPGYHVKSGHSYSCFKSTLKYPLWQKWLLKCLPFHIFLLIVFPLPQLCKSSKL